MAAGIVRRIDELGRIVIPKELRRTMRLKEGDEMEILPSGDAITLKRYSGFESVLKAARSVSRLLAKACDADVLFIGTDEVEIAEGKNRRLYQGARVSESFLESLRKRQCAAGRLSSGVFDVVEANGKYFALEPVVEAGDLVGTAMMLKDAQLSESDKAYMHFCVQLVEVALE